MSRLTPEQHQLMAAGKAVVAHCRDCRTEFFLGELPMDSRDFLKAIRKAKCPTESGHNLYMGPWKGEGAKS
ncbi:hypothetical protein [Chelativorans sp. AA-79]|uniref:hypothetical protein n=1 Tax=Chelativorans sp. AA-79 TaxID=3028735 RepID=UPI0023FA129F|nr:hypothetical protein [Chelativorans sp. AA-79]WEX10348.1 hypothetical protein PVE73_05140 [Chelativorans sp. AA-79]